jgi:hypothetical protein
VTKLTCFFCVCFVIEFFFRYQTGGASVLFLFSPFSFSPPFFFSFLGTSTGIVRSEGASVLFYCFFYNSLSILLLGTAQEECAAKERPP